MFKTRYEFHKIIYRHKTSQSIDIMFAEIFKLIDPVFKISASIGNMDNFCQLTDNSIIDIVELYGSYLGEKILFSLTTDEQERLVKASALWTRIKNRDIYKFVGETINYNFNESYLLSYDETKELTTDDFTILKYSIGYISGREKNPIEHIYFYDPKRFDKRESFIIDKKEVSSLITENYQERYVKVFCRNTSVYKKISNAFQSMVQSFKL